MGNLSDTLDRDSLTTGGGIVAVALVGLAFALVVMAVRGTYLPVYTALRQLPALMFGGQSEPLPPGGGVENTSGQSEPLPPGGGTEQITGNSTGTTNTPPGGSGPGNRS